MAEDETEAKVRVKLLSAIGTAVDGGAIQKLIPDEILSLARAFALVTGKGRDAP
jgi:hypothetical protein